MKSRIEFYQAALKPATDFATLHTALKVAGIIILVWGLVFAKGWLSHFHLQQQNTELEARLNLERQEVDDLSGALSALNAQLQEDDTPHRLEEHIRARQQLLRLLNQQNLVSYAKTLQDLAHIPWQGVALQGLTLHGKQMVLRGEASSPSAVPAWILGFEQSDSLRGHSFGQLAISQNDDGRLSFSLYSSEVAP
ncbi:hypothetical protein [Oceanisphaera avium]|uniref:Fimbrial assembly protein n=1 Tax=Oceanisphaera avium TaxID=1903694 RepID=A0A1Y0CVJ6_9GAMM|nr:hypothetical protein [Oceanisphaera avium]ART79238.1 hypothetical protein CBP12_02995 [Oceanisphaera avium]